MASPTALTPQQYNAYDLASLYLTQNNLPNTSKNRVALASWFMAESAHVPGRPGWITVYNNNPLNITTGQNALIYHQFQGNSLKFASYAGTTRGAQAWGELLRSNPAYKGILTSLQNQDQMGLASSVGRSPWGTSGSTIASLIKNMPQDLATGANLADASGTNSGNPGGLNNFQTAVNKWLALSGIDPKSAMTAEQYQTFLTWYAQTYGNNISGDANIQALGQSHVGKPWTQLVTDTVTMGAPAPDPLSGITGALAGFANLTDPTKMTPRLLHIGAILAGAIVTGAGIWLMIKGSTGGNRPSGSIGGGDIYVEEFSDEEEAAVEEAGAAPEQIAAESTPPIAAPKPRASRRKPKSAGWMDRPPEEPPGGFTPPETSSTFAPQKAKE